MGLSLSLSPEISFMGILDVDFIMLKLVTWALPPPPPLSLPLSLMCVRACVCGTFQIILKEDVVDVGKKGQLLDVKAGFYRNFLLPSGKAQIVTTSLIK